MSRDHIVSCMHFAFILNTSLTLHLNWVCSLDNWSGNKSRAADFGPRQISDDNPHPVS